jgi:HAD superfamily hydrolase (TIGR01509 family)
MIHTLIFDFDGLILDTETPEYESWQFVYESYGCSLPHATWATCIGTGYDESPFDPYAFLEQQVNQTLDRAAVRTVRRARMNELIAQQAILPGVEAYIREAKALGLKLGVASSSSSEWVKGHLRRLGLIQYFDTIKCVDDVQRAKPDPELYRAALAALDTLPGHGLALEDSPNGVLAAKRAGMRCVAIPNAMTASLDFNHADLRVSSMVEMPLAALLERVTG